MVDQSQSKMPEQNSPQSSLAEEFQKLSKVERQRRLASLTDDEAKAILFDWEFWARPNQLTPTVNPKTPLGDWDTWLVMAGRGFGKTRIGSEQVRKWVKDFPIVNLIGPTAADVRDVMVHGIGAGSAILEICPPNGRPKYEPSKRRLSWPNGAVSLLFSAEDPESLRGPQCYKFWCDEVAAWRYQDEAKEQIDFSLRLGTSPQSIVTTTPKPTKLIKELSKNPRTFVTRASTYENRSNLAAKWFEQIVTKYEGTRLGRQELNAELLEDNPGALWTLAQIDALRWLVGLPDMKRIVVGVDPAVTSREDSDLTGIIIAGQDHQWPPHYYVLDDRSLIASPNDWAAAVLGAYRQHKADRVVAEVNNGGDLVEAILRTKDIGFAYKAVHASRGKVIRAEPIAALYEQGRVHHVGAFGSLEDQMCDYDPLTSEKSPDRMDALVWALWELNNPEEIEQITVHEEPVQISSDLDDFDFRSRW